MGNPQIAPRRRDKLHTSVNFKGSFTADFAKYGEKCGWQSVPLLKLTMRMMPYW
jgi:hypothetical protein